MEQSQQRVIKELLGIKSFKCQLDHPFLWGNGWKSPLYFDSRKMLSYPAVRDVVGAELAQAVRNHYPEVECIAAVATNSIALGLMVAQQLNLPFVYVYPQPKDHGLENRIEGVLKPHQKVVIIEDQLSEGRHCVMVEEALKKDGCQVLGLMVVFDFNLNQSKTNLEQVKLESHALLTLNQAISYTQENQIIDSDMAEAIHNWQANPSQWKR